MACIGAPPRVLPSGEHNWFLESTPISGFQGLAHALLYTLNHNSRCFCFLPHVVGVSIHKQLLTCGVDACREATVCHGFSKANT